MKEGINEWTNKYMCECMNEWINRDNNKLIKLINEERNEWSREWINK